MPSPRRGRGEGPGPGAPFRGGYTLPAMEAPNELDNGAFDDGLRSWSVAAQTSSISKASGVAAVLHDESAPAVQLQGHSAISQTVFSYPAQPGTAFVLKGRVKCCSPNARVVLQLGFPSKKPVKKHGLPQLGHGFTPHDENVAGRLLWFLPAFLLRFQVVQTFARIVGNLFMSFNYTNLEWHSSELTTHDQNGKAWRTVSVTGTVPEHIDTRLALAVCVHHVTEDPLATSLCADISLTCTAFTETHRKQNRRARAFSRFTSAAFSFFVFAFPPPAATLTSLDMALYKLHNAKHLRYPLTLRTLLSGKPAQWSVKLQRDTKDVQRGELQRIANDLHTKGISRTSLANLYGKDLGDEILFWLRKHWHFLNDRKKQLTEMGVMAKDKFFNPHCRKDGVIPQKLEALCRRVGEETYGMNFMVQYTVFRYSEGMSEEEWDVTANNVREVNTHWHTDYEDRIVLKCIVLVRDVDKDCGPFTYIRGTNIGGHASGKLRALLQEYLSTTKTMWRGSDQYVQWWLAEQMLARYPELVTKATGRAGLVYFVDTVGFHKGGDAKLGNERLTWFAGLTSPDPWSINKGRVS